MTTVNSASVDAFNNSKPNHANQREQCFELISESPNGLTSKEISRKTGWGLNVFSGRLTELKAAGRILGLGFRREGAEVLVPSGARVTARLVPLPS